MGNNIAVSVTVPIYNTSKYLQKCLDSLASQTLAGIEFILVDDGSSDDSGRICDEYARNDSRFRVIHQDNGGSSVARQSGLNNARGEYVIVCDSDDWVEPDMYRLLYTAAKNQEADIVVCGYYAEYSNGSSIVHPAQYKENDGVVDNEDILQYGANSSWVKLVKKDLFTKTNSCYVKGINLSEDSLIIYKLLKGEPKIIQIKENLYHYRRLLGENSYTNCIKMNNIFQLAYTYFWLKSNYAEEKYSPIVTQRAIDLAFACLRVNDLQESYVKWFISSELKWKNFRSARISLKMIMVCIEKILPVPMSKYIFRNLYRFFYR